MAKEVHVNRKSFVKKEVKKALPNRVENKVLIYSSNPTLGELSKLLDLPVTKVITFLMNNGKMVTINQTLSDDLVAEITINYGFDFEREEVSSDLDLEAYLVEDNPKDLLPRPPVVTIMGHVDHGKTTLIDAIRNSHLVDKEVGGISQAIGAYQVEYTGHAITFIDTPGHEAFTHMRSRGASVTDLVVLVVAADDGVMPQTKEAIDHAKSAGVPIIVAINKIDKPGADGDRVKTELVAYEIVPEEYGGDVVTVNISAKFNKGIDNLLENILLVADMHELKANPHRFGYGVVLETVLDKGEGPKATLLVSNGTICSGDFIVVGSTYGRIRKMTNEFGRVIKTAGPATPVSVIGLNELPNAGDHFMVFESEKEVRELATKRKTETTRLNRNANINVNLDNLFEKISEGQIEEIKLIIKTDTTGSAEALKASLLRIENPEVKVNIIRSAAGAITESDVDLASATGAMIYGFNIRPNALVRKKAEEEKIELRTHDIIYALIEEVEAALKGMLKPTIKEVAGGTLEIIQIFHASKIGNIGGAKVIEGTVKRNSDIRLIREGVVIYTGKLGSLKHGKDDVKEARINFECGITIDGYNDIRVGDIIETFELVEEKAK